MRDQRQCRTVSPYDRATGGLLGGAVFASTTDGHAELLGWLKSFGPVIRVGIEGTSPYGTGVARHLRATDAVA